MSRLLDILNKVVGHAQAEGAASTSKVDKAYWKGVENGAKKLHGGVDIAKKLDLHTDN